MRFDNQRNDGADRRAARDAENVWIRQRITQQSLKAGASNGKRCAHKNAEKDARQANIKDDELIFAGELTALSEKNAEQIVTQAVERHRDSAELECDHDHNE